MMYLATTGRVSVVPGTPCCDLGSIRLSGSGMQVMVEQCQSGGPKLRGLSVFCTSCATQLPSFLQKLQHVFFL